MLAYRPAARMNGPVLADLRDLVEGALLVFAALFPIVNPIGLSPLFLVMTKGYPPEIRAVLAKRIARNSLVLLLSSLFIGSYVLDFFGLSVPIVQVAGSIVLCTLGWNLLQAPDPAPRPELGGEAAQSPEEMLRHAFYPLTLPLTVGPGSISVAIALGANRPYAVRPLLLGVAGQLLGALAVALAVYLCYRYAERILRALGPTGTSVALRLSAFILLCIGVQIGWNGVRALAATLPAAAR
jgi:multiple antibiotic resistance protein